MDCIPRTPDDQKCARPSCHHPFAAHDLLVDTDDENCGCQLRCAACGCSDFAYPEDFPSTPQGINSTREKIDHATSETPKTRAPRA